MSAVRIPRACLTAVLLMLPFASGPCVSAQDSNVEVRVKELDTRVRELESELHAMQPSEAEARATIESFQKALNDRDLLAIAKVVAPDIVVFENGHRNEGWPDFRDNHLKPEFKEPATPSPYEILKLVVGPAIAWAYTHQIISATDKQGQTKDVVVWSVYVLEAREGKWEIAALDWSVRVPHSSSQ